MTSHGQTDPAVEHAAARPLAGKTVVVGVGGGIAAYKAAFLVRLLIKAGADVRAVMTAGARQFLGEMTLQALTGHGVFTDLFDREQESEIGHIAIADGADLVVVAPATANLLARVSAGRADDALSAVLLATTAPVLLAPSMNVNMWQHPTTQANLQRLAERPGVHVIDPESGFLACRWVGPGRLAEPEDIAEACARLLGPRDLSGRKVVVSAGPTREPLDPVRFLSNRSSGKMGFAIALAAARRGASVTLVAGPVSLDTPLGVERVNVTTAADMGAAVAARASSADAVIMAAAVGDLRPASVSEHKIKKADLADEPTLELARNADILAGLGASRSGSSPILVGFAAETNDVVSAARGKLERKKCDLVVANDVSAGDAGFGVDTNRVVLVDPDGDHPVPLSSKLSVAHHILDWLAQRLPRKGTSA